MRLPRHHGKDPDLSSRPAFDLDWCHDQERPDRRHPIDVRDVLEVESICSVHDKVRREAIGSANIDAQVVDSDASNVSLHQQTGRVFTVTREVHLAVGVAVLVG